LRGQVLLRGRYPGVAHIVLIHHRTVAPGAGVRIRVWMPG
jgi:hypothetical protein